MEENHYIEVEGWLYILTPDAYREWLTKCAQARDMVEFPDSVVSIDRRHYHHMYEGYDDFDALLEYFLD